MAFNPGADLSTPTYAGPKDGIFVRKHKVISMEIHYDTKVAPTWNPSSVVLTVKIQPEGKDWDREVKIFGDYKVEDGAIVDEGTTWRVWSFIRDLSVKTGIKASYNGNGQLIIEGHDAPVEGLFDEFVGQQLWSLAYPGYTTKEGKAGFSTWNRFHVQEEGQDDQYCKDVLRNMFIDQVAGGWEKKYQPWLLEKWEVVEELQKSAKFAERMKEAGATPNAQTVSTGGDPGGDGQTFTPDDDLPF